MVTSENSITLHVTEEMVAKYGELMNDLNPIHFEDEKAKEAGYPTKIAHGMLTMALALKAFQLEESWFVSAYRARFTAPVLVGQLIQVETCVTNNNEAFIEAEVVVLTEDHRKVLEGRVTVQKGAGDYE